MKKYHGITATLEGTYVHVVAVKPSSGWKITRTSSWQIGSMLRNSLLMGSRILLGVESHWINQLPGESDHLITSSESLHLSPCIHDAQRKLHLQMLEKNCFGIYPDDAFLCTLPLQYSKQPQDSFITIFKDENIFKIGITVNRTLSAVFSLPSLMFAQLTGYLERIRRYWNKISPDTQFPSVVFTFNDQDITPGAPFNVVNINLPVSIPAEVKAFGIALCSIEHSVPSFSGPTEASSLTGLRTAVFSISLALLLVTAILTGYVYIKNYFTTQNLKQCETTYQNILNNNSEIRDLTKSGESLAKKLLRIEKFAASPTRWSTFLELIGKERPEKLYFEHLGSELKQSDSHTAKIALSGWADSETTVTDLIQRLNTSSIVSNVTLSTIERNDKNNTTRFKIVCIVQLSEN